MVFYFLTSFLFSSISPSFIFLKSKFGMVVGCDQFCCFHYLVGFREYLFTILHYIHLSQVFFFKSMREITKTRRDMSNIIFFSILKRVSVGATPLTLLYLYFQIPMSLEEPPTDLIHR